MAAEEATADFFAPGPTITVIAQPCESDDCHCGKLPHLCTCDYYRQLRRREQEQQQLAEHDTAGDVLHPEGLLLDVSASVGTAEESQQPVKRRRITGKKSLRSS